MNSRITKIAKLLYVIEYKGRYCKNCGFDGFSEPWFVDFHHRETKDKKYEVKNKIMSGDFSKLKKEIDKCDLLCGRCHRKFHSYWKEYDENKEAVIEKLKTIRRNKGITKHRKEFSFDELEIISELSQRGLTIKEIAQRTNRDYHSIKHKIKELGCSVKRDSREKKIDVKKIVDLYNENKSLREIGRQLGVSYMLVGNRLRKLGLPIKSQWDRIEANEKMIIKHYKDGMSMASIEKKTKINKLKIRSILIKNGIEIRKSHMKLNNIYNDDILNLRKEGWSYKKIAEKYGVTINAIRSRVHSL